MNLKEKKNPALQPHLSNEIRLLPPISAKKPTLLGLRSVSDIRVCVNRDEQECERNVITPCVQKTKVIGEESVTDSAHLLFLFKKKLFPLFFEGGTVEPRGEI